MCVSRWVNKNRPSVQKKPATTNIATYHTTIVCSTPAVLRGSHTHQQHSTPIAAAAAGSTLLGDRPYYTTMLLTPFNTRPPKLGLPSSQACCNIAATKQHGCRRTPRHAQLPRRAVVRCEAVAAPAKTPAVADRFEPQVCAILGTQWGDEGKGKLVDILAQQYDIVARAQVRIPMDVSTYSRHHQ